MPQGFPFLKPSGDTVVMGIIAWTGVLLLWIGWTGRAGDLLAAVFAPSALQDTTTPGA